MLTGSLTPLTRTAPRGLNSKYPSVSLYVCSLTTIEPGVANPSMRDAKPVECPIGV